MDQENIILNEMSDKDKSKKYTNECICKTETGSQIQKNKFVVVEGKREGERNKFGVWD